MEVAPSGLWAVDSACSYQFPTFLHAIHHFRIVHNGGVHEWFRRKDLVHP